MTTQGIEACARIIYALCIGNFMSGFMGDVSPEYQRERLDYLTRMSALQRRRWLEYNRRNILWCGLTDQDIVAATL